ncbi:MAG: NADH:ubiquinone reductase (Na(+)-transporting) subunit C [Cytophagales bacterium]|nr:NADH:ubiquinone reductase (Na(+)-transporting) subunit C [Cytophagales bacterium]
MKQSNAYVLIFTVVMTVVCAGLLGGTANGLKEKIAAAKKLDARKQILSAVTDVEGKDINALFENNIKGYVVNSAGDIVETTQNKKGQDVPLVAEKINPRTEYKKASLAKKHFPVFEYSEGGKIQAYVLPIYGNGLWDEVWGYIAIEPDFKTVKGIGFGHKAETPGLGARITEGAVQERFAGRTIYDAAGVVKLAFLKGEGNQVTNEYDVDGLSGASMTTKGVNAMLASYLGYYKNFFNKAGGATATPVQEEAPVEPTPAVVDSNAVVVSDSSVVDSVSANETVVSTDSATATVDSTTH